MDLSRLKFKLQDGAHPPRMRYDELHEGDMMVEWSDKYIEYTRLIDLLLKAEKYQYKLGSSTHSQADFSDQFLDRCHNDLITHLTIRTREIKVFYYKELANLDKWHAEMIDKRQQVADIRSGYVHEAASNNLYELYRGYTLLRTYCTINCDFAMDLVHTHDRLLISHQPLTAICQSLLRESGIIDISFFEGKIASIIDLYAGYFTNGDLYKAEIALKDYSIPRTALHRRRESATFLDGMMLMFFFYMLFAIADVWITYTFVDTSVAWDMPLVIKRLLRLQSTVCIFTLGVGFDILMWEKRKVNYALVLEFPPGRLDMSYRKFLYYGLSYMTFFLFCYLMCVAHVATSSIYVSKDIYRDPVLPITFGRYFSGLARSTPLLLWALLPLVVPLQVIIKSVLFCMPRHFVFEKMVMRMWWRNIGAFYYRAAFPVFLWGDQFISLNPFLADIIYVISHTYFPAYLAPMWLTIPSIVRAIQCYKNAKVAGKAYPNMMNMGKYLVSIPGVYLDYCMDTYFDTYPGLVYFFLFWKYLEHTYKNYWDIWEDMALMNGGAGALVFHKNKNHGIPYKKTPFLQRPSKFTSVEAFFIVVYNCLVRYSFLITVFYRTPVTTSFWLESFLAFVEYLRRIMWNILRVENQAATNMEGYVAIRFLPLNLQNYAGKKRSSNQETHPLDSPEGHSELRAVSAPALSTNKIHSNA